MKIQKFMFMRRQGFIPVVIILFVLIGIVGYLSYKNAPINDGNIPIKSSPPFVNVNTGDSWLKYYDVDSKYTIDYPPRWGVTKTSVGELVTIYNRDLYSGGDNSPHGSVIIEQFYNIPSAEYKLLTISKVMNEIKLDCKEEDINSSIRLDCWVKIPNQNKYLNIELVKDKDKTINNMVDRIFATFKFTN